MAMERDSEGRLILRLDGTMGTGPSARLTIITTDKVNGISEETYMIPYILLDFKKLQELTDATFILGYRIEKVIPAGSELTEIGDITL